MEALEDRVTPSFYGNLAQDAYTQLSSAQSGISNALNAVDLPLIDGELGSQATILSNQVLAALRDRLAATPANPQAGDIQSEVSGALGGLLGDTDNDGTPGRPSDVLVSGNLTSSIGIEVRLHQEMAVTSTSLNAHLGLSSLPVRITSQGGVQLSVGFDCELAFGFDGTHFSIDTTRVLPSGHELDLGLDATVGRFDPGGKKVGPFSASASLGPFTASATDAGGTDVHASLHLDGLGGTPTVTPPDGHAFVNLGLAIGAGLDFPSIGTDFQLDWSFDPSNPAAAPPEARFNNVTLDLGQFVSDILGPVLNDIQSATSSFEPIIKALTTPIPGISDISRFIGRGSVTLLDLAADAGGGAGFDELANVVDHIGSFITQVDGLHLTVGDAGVQLNLGSFDFGGQDLRNVASPDDLVPSVTQDIQTGSLSTDAGNLYAALSSNDASYGISFPIIDDPVDSAFQLILGRNPTLVHFTADANLDLSSKQLDGLSVAGVGLNFEGDISLKAHLGFGYDTKGLVEAINDAGSEPSNIPSDILDGFYLDAGTGPGATPTGVQLEGSIGPVLSFDFGIFSLDFSGAIDTGRDSDGNLLPIGIDLVSPGQDGKLRFGDSAPCGLLHPYGKLNADVSFTLSVGVSVFGHFIGYRQSFGIGSATLLDLADLDCCNVQPPSLKLGVMDGGPNSAGQLDLILGGQTDVWEGEGYKTETRIVPDHTEDSNNGIDETFDITHLGDDQGGGESVVVSAFGVSQEFDHVTSIYAYGGLDSARNLTVNVEPGVESPAAISGGSGHAYLTYSGSGDCYLSAGMLSSSLAGGSGTSHLDGGPGDDTLVAGSGANQVIGGGGSNTIVLQAPNTHANDLRGGYADGTEDSEANNVLDVLSLPTSQVISVQPDGRGSFLVTVGTAGDVPLLSINGGSFNSLALGGAGGTGIAIGDLSGTALQQITAAVTPDVIPPARNISKFQPPPAPGGGFYSQSAVSLLDHGGSSGGSSGGKAEISIFDPYTGTVLADVDNVFDQYSDEPLTYIDHPRGNTVTIAGWSSASDPNAFSESTLTDPKTGAAGPTHVTVGHLAVDIANMGSDDSVILQGGGHGDYFYVTPYLLDRFAVVAEDGGPGATLFVNGFNLPTGTTDISDLQANGLANRVVFSWHAISFGVRVTESTSVYFDDNSYDLAVVGPTGVASQPGETFVANRSGGTTYIGGGYGDDTIDVRGSGAYTLNGNGGEDHYVVHWNLTGPSVTFDARGTTGSETLEVDDSSNLAGRSCDYQVTSDRILRIDYDVLSFDGITLDVSFENSISFSHMSSVTLDTGHGSPVANQIDLYAMGVGTSLNIETEDGVNHIDVIGTTAGATTTITSGSGNDDVQVSGTQTLDSIAGSVIVQGNGRTSVTVNDQYTAPLMGEVFYFFSDRQLQVIHEEFSGVSAFPTNAQIGYSGLASLTVDAVQSAPYDALYVASTVGTALLTLNTGIIGSVNVGGASDSLDSIGELAVNGGPGVALIVNDSGSTGLPPDVPSDITAFQVSIAYQIAGGRVSRSMSWGYSTLDGGGGGASLYDITYTGIASLELDGSDAGSSYVVADAAVPATIKGGSGPDSFLVGNSLDAIGPLTVNGGGGNDMLRVDDSRGTGLPTDLPPDASNFTSDLSYTVTGQDVVRSGTFGYSITDGAGGGMSYADISYRSIAALELDGNSTGAIDVESTSVPTAINAGSGSNTVNVGDNSNRLDGIQGALTVSGRPGAGTTLVVSDRGTTTDQVYEVFATEVDRTHPPDSQGNYIADMAAITYSHVSNLVLEGGAGSNLIYVESTVAGTTTDVYGGTGGRYYDEFVTVLSSNQDATIQGPLNLHGQSGPPDGNIAVLYDAGDFATRAFTMTAGALYATTMAPITYDGMIYDVLYTSERTSAVVDVESTAPNVPTYVVAGPGDPVSVGSPASPSGNTLANIRGPLIIRAGYGGQLPVTIDDSGDTMAHPNVVLSPAGPYDDYQLTGLAPAPIVLTVGPASPVSISGGLGNDMFTVTDPLSYTGVTIDGGGGTNTLAGPNAPNAWAITGSNSGTLDSIAFRDFPNLVGGGTSDDFRFNPAGASIGTITGGTGLEALDYSQFTTGVSANLGDGTNGTAPDVRGNVSRINVAIGGSGNDTLNAGSVPNATLTGGLGTNTLTGTGAGDVVVESNDLAYTLSDGLLTGASTGFVDTLAGIRVASLTGTGATSNTFTVDGWTGTGSLTAPAGTGGVSATKTAGFTLTNTALTATDGLSLHLGGIARANLTTTAATGSPSFVVDASAFSGITSLTAAGTAGAVLFGGAANGSSLNATGSGACVLIGGIGNDTITDTGTGSNILIGDGGINTLVGNGRDILIGGPTVYDRDTGANLAALDAILAEWTSSDPYATRIGKITAGVGPGGTWALNGSTCLVERTANVLSDGTSAVQANWFIVEPRDKVTKQAGETETVA